MCGRDAQSLSEGKPSAVIQIQYLWLATNQCVVAMVQYRRDSKMVTQNHRSSCFLPRIEAMRSLAIGLDFQSASASEGHARPCASRYRRS